MNDKPKPGAGWREWWLCEEMSYPIEDFSLETIKEEYGDKLVAHVIEHAAFEEMKRERNLAQAEREKIQVDWQREHTRKVDLDYENGQLKRDVERLKIVIEQHRGALGYSVPGHITQDFNIKCGICDSLRAQLEAATEAQKIREIFLAKSYEQEIEAERAAREEAETELESWKHSYKLLDEQREKYVAECERLDKDARQYSVRAHTAEARVEELLAYKVAALAEFERMKRQLAVMREEIFKRIPNKDYQDILDKVVEAREERQPRGGEG
jgi:hypothetical protein